MKHQLRFRVDGCRDDSNRAGAEAFTFPELLVVIGVLCLLTVFLLPAHSANRSGVKSFQCLNNQRQLTLAWIMYATENMDHLPSEKPAAGTLSWTLNPDNTNETLLLTYKDSTGKVVSSLARYVTSAEFWKCPADIASSPQGARVRSVSFNGPLAGANALVAIPSYPIGRTYRPVVRTLSELRKPSEVLVTMDEHPDSINDSLLMFDSGKIPSTYAWRDLPASYHSGAAGCSFADGRAEMHLWNDNTTKQPIRRISKPWGSSLLAPDSADIFWMNERMPYKESH